MKKLFLSFALIVLLASCSVKTNTGAVSVATTFYPLAEFTRHIAGSGVTVTQVVPDGVEPHEYEPLPADIATLQSSNVVVFNGIVDEWVTDLRPELASNGVVVTRILDDFPRMSFSMNGIDPHVWVSPRLALSVVKKIADALIKADPSHADAYAKNGNAYIGELRALDEDFKKGLKDCALKRIVTSHEAFGYLAEDYGITMTTIAGVSPDSEPSAKKLAEIIDTMKKEGIKTVFTEPLASPKVVDTVTKETGASKLVLNPVEGLTPEEKKNGADYVSIMRQNLANLRTALRCK